jgi:hypothetical protein
VTQPSLFATAIEPILPELGLVTRGTPESFAVFSADEKYRYILGRVWDPSLPLWCWCLLNPSTASHEKPDPTLTKGIGFTTRGGGGGLLFVNTMALRETYPSELVRRHKSGEHARGEHNAAAIRWAKDRAAVRIAAWGNIPRAVHPIAQFGAMTFRENGDAQCFGFTNSFEPRHPLMLAYSTPRVSMLAAAAAASARAPSGPGAAQGVA